MAKKEKFGKFVLLEEIDSSGLGSEYRAAKLGQTGLEKIVSVLRLGTAISSNADVAKSLMDQAKVAAQLQNPNVVKIFGIGKVDASYYISYEFVEGKSLKAIFGRCRQEGFPFSVDHTLLIASKICSALEYAHGRKNEGGRYFHGLVTPASVIVSYEGEVRVRGFGYWPGRVRDAGLSPEDSLYLAPEQASGGAGDTRSDIFAVGAILFETLTGHALFEGGRDQDCAARLAQAKLQSPTGDDDSLPKPIADILGRSLAADPAGRYAEIQEMRKAIDTLLFSGDFTPTTFNLAFFMHSLFREDIERESKALKEEKEASYLEHLTGEETAKSGAYAPVKPPPPPAPAPAPATVVAPPPPPVVPPPKPHAAEARHAPSPTREEPAHEAREAHAPAHVEPPGLSPKEAAAGFTFHKEEPKSNAPMFIGIAAVVVLILGGVGYMVMGGKGAPAPAPPPTQAAPPVTTLSPDAAKVKELEEKLKALEDDKKKAEDAAREKAKKQAEDTAKREGKTVDPAQLQLAQEEAAKKARAEQDKKAQEEKKRLEEEKRAAEIKAAEEAASAAKAAEEQRKAEEARAAAAATATTVAAAPTTKAGALVNLTDAGVIAPIADKTPPLVYPPIALRQGAEGTVELNILVDERGNVIDAQIVTGIGGKSGLNEAAVDNVKRRKYRPATKDGVQVKVWIPVRVQFRLPK